MKSRVGMLAASLAATWPFAPLGSAEGAETAEDPPACYYAASLVSTTLGYRPSGGPISGPQKDVTVGLGLGRSLGESLFVELDIGPTFADGDYVALSLVPGLVWAFHPNLYASLRLIVPVHPELELAAYPGLGAAAPLDDAIAVFGEVNLLSNLSHGTPDAGLTLTVGVTITL